MWKSKLTFHSYMQRFLLYEKITNYFGADIHE